MCYEQSSIEQDRDNNEISLEKNIEKLQREAHEMVAMIARLKQSQLNALEYIGSLDATPLTIKLHDLVAVAENETPPQSLQQIETAAIDKYHSRLSQFMIENYSGIDGVMSGVHEFKKHYWVNYK